MLVTLRVGAGERDLANLIPEEGGEKGVATLTKGLEGKRAKREGPPAVEGIGLEALLEPERESPRVQKGLGAAEELIGVVTTVVGVRPSVRRLMFFNANFFSIDRGSALLFWKHRSRSCD